MILFMKIDRLLNIIIYLINNDNVSARYLAERFGVTVRTIQRDMTSISSIGIPVYANNGKKGGYSILPSYKMKNADIRGEEQQIIIQALESLATTYTNDSLNALIEKYNAIITKEGGQQIFWDFGVAKENQEVQRLNTVLEKAIDERRYISFDYRSANGKQSRRTLQPLAIHYKWYSWYLFGYSEEGEEYKTCKVARISNLVISAKQFHKEHGDVQQRMKESEEEYYQTCLHIEVQFPKEEQKLLEEYFPDCPVENIDDDRMRMFIDVPQKERQWKALLLSFGDKVKIIGPKEYRDELIETAKKFLSNYDI